MSDPRTVGSFLHPVANAADLQALAVDVDPTISNGSWQNLCYNRVEQPYYGIVNTHTERYYSKEGLSKKGEHSSY